MAAQHYPVVIVGGSVAGCVAALAFAQRGIRPLVLERHRSLDQYKHLCTHFIQPAALPVLHRLGLDRLLEERGAVRTKAAFLTPAGRLDPRGDYSPDPALAHGYNIERRVLDPLLRRQLILSGLDLRLDHGVSTVRTTQEGWEITARSQGQIHSFTADLLVAADGRSSTLALLLGRPAETAVNERAACFAYFEGITAPEANRSLFMTTGDEMAFLYPLADRRCLLAAYVSKPKSRAWRASGAPQWALLKFVRDFGDVPNLEGALQVSRVLGYTDYPSLARAPTDTGIAFIGDAALCLDPMSGVGVAFAIISADLLAQATYAALAGQTDLEASLGAYRTAFNARLLPHAIGIRADSIMAKTSAAVLQTYRRIRASEALQSQFIALSGRLISPRQFQQSYIGAALAARAAPAMERDSGTAAT